MIIEATIKLEYLDQTKPLIVKMIHIDPVRYFFIREDEPTEFLAGATLELTYESGIFRLSSFAGEIRTPGIDSDKVNTITEALIRDSLFWNNG